VQKWWALSVDICFNIVLLNSFHYECKPELNAKRKAARYEGRRFEKRKKKNQTSKNFILILILEHGLASLYHSLPTRLLEATLHLFNETDIRTYHEGEFESWNGKVDNENLPGSPSIDSATGSSTLQLMRESCGSSPTRRLLVK
jgi:hypothetical protein